jgi:diguanylate cyclase (GGDEF)-like protein/PAS domain S-box-containing protein
MDPTAIDSRRLLDNLPSGVVVHAADTRILYANPRALELLHLSKEQALGRQALAPEWNLLREDGQLMAEPDYPVNRVLATGESVVGEVLGIVNGQDSEPTWLLVNAYQETAPDGKLQVVVSFVDVSFRHQIPFRRIVDMATDVVIVTDANPVGQPGPRIVYTNQAFEALTGFSSQEALGQSPRILQGPGTDPVPLKRIHDALALGQAVSEVVLNYSKSGQAYWLDLNINPLRDHHGKITHFVGIERDVTNAQEAVMKWRDAAATDALTGLLNRRGFAERSAPLMRLAAAAGKPCFLVTADLDHFKRVNDKFGHAEGDRLLQTLATETLRLFRQDDVCARFGGEEFVVLLHAVDTQAALAVAERWRMTIGAQLQTPDGVAVTLSLGVAFCQPGQTLDQALARSDAALYQAKQGGRNRTVVA